MTAALPLPLAASRPALGWLGIARLGLVQAMLGAVVVLTTSTLNSVMVVELALPALPALLPGLLVALHHAVQLSRPRMGFGSDVGGRRTPWILSGMVTLALGGAAAAVATTWMAHDRLAGIALAALAFIAVGLWGAAQAIGFAAGGLFGAAASDAARWLIGPTGGPGSAYATVFFVEAGLFIVAALLAAKVSGTNPLVGAKFPTATPAARADVPGLQA